MTSKDSMKKVRELQMELGLSSGGSPGEGSRDWHNTCFCFPLIR